MNAVGLSAKLPVVAVTVHAFLAWPVFALGSTLEYAEPDCANCKVKHHVLRWQIAVVPFSLEFRLEEANHRKATPLNERDGLAKGVEP